MKVIGEEKIGEYAKVNKYAKYSFAMSVNTGEENLDKAYCSPIFPPPNFPTYGILRHIGNDCGIEHGI